MDIPLMAGTIAYGNKSPQVYPRFVTLTLNPSPLRPSWRRGIALMGIPAKGEWRALLFPQGAATCKSRMYPALLAQVKLYCKTGANASSL